MSKTRKAKAPKAAPKATATPAAPQGVSPQAQVARQRITLTPQQKQLILDANQDLLTARRNLDLVVTTICAGVGITDGQLLGLEGESLVIQVPAPTEQPKEPTPQDAA